MKKTITYIVLLTTALLSVEALYSTNGAAEGDDFWGFRKEMFEEFEEFREEINREYVEFLEEAWLDYTLLRGKEPEMGVKPKEMPHAPSVKEMETREMELHLADPLLAESSAKKSDSPAIRGRAVRSAVVNFYGSKFIAHHNIEMVPLAISSERDVASFWRYLAGLDFTAMIYDIQKIREEQRLNDWAIYKLVRAIAQSIDELQTSSNRALFSHFMLFQCGYNVRIGFIGDSLELLLPIRETIYNRSYYSSDDLNYYTEYGDRKKSTPIRASDFSRMRRGKLISMQIAHSIRFPYEVHHRRVEYGDFSIDVSVNRNLIEFYSDYPCCDLRVYSRAAVEQALAQQLQTCIGKQINGKSHTDALQWVLSFVQHGFAYKIDHEQFGVEKPFFVEEMFYYPYSDCEDSAILFGWIVKHLLNMDVILLNYTNHIAAAVDIGDRFLGAYYTIEDRAYTICDPSYRNAVIGEYMPQYRDETPTAIRF